MAKQILTKQILLVVLLSLLIPSSWEAQTLPWETTAQTLDPTLTLPAAAADSNWLLLRDISGSLEVPTRCYSDSSQCQVYGDCCQPTAKIPDPVSHRSPRFTCLPIEPLSPDGEASDAARATDCCQLQRPAALVVSACPAASSGSINDAVAAAAAAAADPRDVEACGNFNTDEGFRRLTLSSIPVFGPDGVLYRSVHCLRCHRPPLSEPISPDRFLTNLTVRCQRPEDYVGRNASAWQGELMRLLLSGGSLPRRCHLAFRVQERLVHRCYAGLPQLHTAGGEKSPSGDCLTGGTSYAFSAAKCRVYRNSACAKDPADGEPQLQPDWLRSQCGGGSSGILTQSNHESFSVRPRPSLLDSVFNFNLDPRLLAGQLAAMSTESPAADGQLRDSKNESSSGDSPGNVTEEAASGRGGPASAAGLADWTDWATMAAQAASAVAALSLTCLYLSRRRLRNRSGLLLVSHALSLAAVNILSLVEAAIAAASSGDVSGSPWTCLLALFCMDAGFTWAGLFGVDLLRTLTNLLARPSAPSRRYARFAAVGWGLPAVPAAVAAGLHFGDSPALFDAKSCGLPETSATTAVAAACRVGLAFAPWALALAFNVACLIGVAACLGRAASQAPAFEHRSTGGGRWSKRLNGRARRTLRRTMLTAGRVSAVLGVAWLPYCCLILAGFDDPASGCTSLPGCSPTCTAACCWRPSPGSGTAAGWLLSLAAASGGTAPQAPPWARHPSPPPPRPPKVEALPRLRPACRVARHLGDC
ncbi:hypothetical protein BOX15_Mlig009698g1 [Macrostomum lignano]|uniref:G-protein coupled receptors family 2 profile 2 domain-containing protein n=1 Tax=Macrostomum lignano TaxID=282301 RepID=A0A267FI08_9PLAT|nr:hypothetical protein BOX15_Mlig009698g1 [Macrostomum lignano]